MLLSYSLTPTLSQKGEGVSNPTIQARVIAFFHPQLPDVTALARAHPDASIVLIHTGSPVGHSAYAGKDAQTHATWLAGMKELAARFPWIDIDRAGIYGHSGGGYATADAMFRYPDFFKVGISEAGNHDNRVYEDDWAEKWQGLLKSNPDGTTNYDNQANQLVAKRLKGKLLLAHGTMDTNVPPNNTLLVVNELIKANKDFDLLMLPNRGHGFGNEPYMIRRRWDYFVRHLLGAEPPKEYELHPPSETRSPSQP